MTDRTKRIFMPCSGQSWTGKKRTWGIHRLDGPAWWRSCGIGGKIRLFASYKAAEKAALKLETDNAQI